MEAAGRSELTGVRGGIVLVLEWAAGQPEPERMSVEGSPGKNSCQNVLKHIY